MTEKVDSGDYTSETKWRRQIALALLKQGFGQHGRAGGLGVAADAVNGLVGGYMLRGADMDEREGNSKVAALLAEQPGFSSGTTAPVVPQSTPAASGEVSDPGGKEPASIRYNNPGAQYPGPVASSYGSTGHGTIGGGHKIAQFPDAESGAAAQFALLEKGYAGMPLDAAISKWSGGNSSGAYAARVAKELGVPPNTIITPEFLRSPQGVKLAQSMAQFETGRPYPLSPEQWQGAQARAFGGGASGNTITDITPQPGGVAESMMLGPQPSGPPIGSPERPMSRPYTTGGQGPVVPSPVMSQPPAGFGAGPPGVQTAQALPTPQPTPQGPPASQPGPSTGPSREQVAYYQKLVEEAKRTGNPKITQMAMQYRAQVEAQLQKGSTDDIKEYEYARRQDPKTPGYTEWYRANKASSASNTNVNVDQRQETQFAKSIAERQAKRFDELIEGGLNAKQFTSYLMTLTDLRKNYTPGLEAVIKSQIGPIAEAVGVKVEGLSSIQATEAIIARMAPQMRVPGSGATSDFEARQFIKALPGLMNNAEGQQLVSQTLQSVEEAKIAASEIASRAAAGEITPREAERELRALPSPYQLFRETHGRVPGDSGQQKPAEAGDWQKGKLLPPPLEGKVPMWNPKTQKFE